MKKREDLKKIVSIAITPRQHSILKDLSRYTKKNVSEVVRALLPSAEEIEAFQAYQDFCDIDEPHRNEVFDKIRNTKRLFFETTMSSHFHAPIGLQCATISYFDKTGKEIAKLFKNWINALRSFGGCRFEKDKFKYPSDTYIYYICLAPGESKKDIDQLIARYCIDAPNAEVNAVIKRSARVVPKKTKKKLSGTKNH